MESEKERDDFIPLYLDKDPEAFMGLSLAELSGLMITGFFIIFPVLTLILVVVTGMLLMLLMSVVLSIGGAVLFTNLRAKKIREQQKGKPMNYSKHKTTIAIEKFKLKHRLFFRDFKPFFVVEDGKWGR